MGLYQFGGKGEGGGGGALLNQGNLGTRPKKKYTHTRGKTGGKWDLISFSVNER